MDSIQEEVPSNVDVKFSIDNTAIERIQNEDQDIELQSLGLSVFDQSVYEKGVIAQVGKALTGDSDHFLKEEYFLSDKEEGQLDDEGVGEQVAENDDEKGDGITEKKNELKAATNGTVDTVSTIENYLRKQIKLHERKKLQEPGTSQRKASFIFKKKKQQPQLFDPNDIKESKNKIKDFKKEKKTAYLGPIQRKKSKKEKLGARKGRCGRDLEPALQPGEENYWEESSGVEEPYSDEAELSLPDEKVKAARKNRSGSSWQKRKRSVSSGSEFLPSQSDSSSDEKPKAKKSSKKVSSKKKKRKEYLFFEKVDTDDSDWDSSDELPKSKGTKELDDGDSEVFCRRIKEYERVNSSSGVVSIEGDLVMPTEIWEKLYDYQKKAVKWFWDLDQKLTGGILGDEMGLGKTIQVVAFLAALHKSDISYEFSSFEGLGPTLIICPTTVMHQWVREFHRWYPPIRVAILHESGTYKGKDRSKLLEIVHRRGSHGIIITSYNGLVQYKDDILRKEWHYVVLDEGHKIRNNKAKVTETAKMLDTPHRIILSGSPLQNNLQELWCLFDFVCPGKLGTIQTFMEMFAVPIMQGGYSNASKTQVMTAHKCATILKDTISPYLMRRMKEDVSGHINLPEKKEQVLFCRLSEEQRMLYKEYIAKIDIQDMIRGRAKIFVALINMRKICNHPDLYSGGPNRNFKLSGGLETPSEDHFGYWKRAGKMIVVETLLKLWHQQGHRVLLFTQSKKMLLIMEDFVKRKKYKYLKLDGQTAVAARQPLIDKFNKEESYFLMLLTTKVGGLGVNLTGANRVVIYDPDWNPATDSQARERAWRIGQQRDVTIYRLITSGTIEEKIYHRQIFKQFLSNKILKDPKQRRFFKSNDLVELFTLSETVNNGITETAAIFAGTGSEIEVPKKMDEKPKNNVPFEKVTFSDSKIEQMKKIAQMLSKKIGESSKALEMRKGDTDKVTEVPSLYGPDGTIDSESARKVISSKSVTKEEPSEPEKVTETRAPEPNVLASAVVEKESKKHKKKKKKKQAQEIFATCEGQEVPHLVKKRKYKKGEKEKREYMSQDDYVLKKLFSKDPDFNQFDDLSPQVTVVRMSNTSLLKVPLSATKPGIDTAMRHDTIMEGGPNDYAIVEAEAEKLAQSALKALKQSEEQVPPVFSTLLRRRKKEDEDDDLLGNIRRRNMIVEASSGEKYLLSNMISFLQSQGGTSSTDQMVKEFKYKVGEGKTPLFKVLLQRVATFYRAPDRVGYWTIKDEFNSPSTSSGLMSR